MEIRVEPKARAQWPIVFCGHGNTPATENPSRTASFERSFQQRIAGESAPRFQCGPNTLFVSHYRDQIARPAAAQHCDQLWQEAGVEILSLDIESDLSLHRGHFKIYQDSLEPRARAGNDERLIQKNTTINRSNEPFQCSLRAYPLVRSRQLNCHTGKENVHGRSVRRPAVIG